MMRRALVFGVVAALVVGAVLFARRYRMRSIPERFPESQDIQVGNRPTGYAKGGNGATHRPARTTCPSLLPRAAEVASFDELANRSRLREHPDLPPSALTPSGDACHHDSDCREHPHGQCREPLPDGPTGCVYGCVTDQECGTGRICLCGEPVGRCVPAACSSDDDCARPNVCAQYFPHPGCFLDTGFACQSPRDECTVDRDCKDHNTCAWESGHRRCLPIHCKY